MRAASLQGRIHGESRERYVRVRRGASRGGRRGLLFYDVVHRKSSARLSDTTEADHSLARELRAVATDENLFAGVRLHERTVRALVDECELVAADLDPRVHAGDQIAFDDEVVLLRAAQRRALAALADRDLSALVAEAQPLRAGS